MRADGHSETDTRSDLDKAMSAATRQVEKCANHGFSYEQPTCRSLVVRGYDDERTVTIAGCAAEHHVSTVVGMVEGEVVAERRPACLIGRVAANVAMRQLYEGRDRQMTVFADNCAEMRSAKGKELRRNAQEASP